MSSMFVAIMWLSIIFMKEKAECSVDEVFAISGGTATLEWIIEGTYIEIYAISINVFNSDEIMIACVADMVCQPKTDPSMYCEIRNASSNEWRVSVVLVNITQANSGNYICQIKHGPGKEENITIELKIIDASTVASSPGDNGGTSTFASSPGDNGDVSTVASSSGHNGGPRLEHFGVGLVIVAILLVITGVLILLTHWCKNASKGLDFTDSPPLNRPVFRLSNIELSHTVTEERNRRLPIPVVQVNACSGTKKSNYPKVYKKTKSLQNLLDHSQDFWSPVQKSLSLQTLIKLSYTIGRRANSKESVGEMCNNENDNLSCSLEGSADGMKLEELYSKIRKDKILSDDEQNTCAKSLSLSNSRHGSFEQELQEDLYSTIDETENSGRTILCSRHIGQGCEKITPFVDTQLLVVNLNTTGNATLSVYDYARANGQVENIQEDHMNSESGNSDYDYASLPAL